MHYREDLADFVRYSKLSSMITWGEHRLLRTPSQPPLRPTSMMD